MVLCFRFVSRFYVFLTLITKTADWECTRNCEGTQSEQQPPASQRDSPQNMKVCWEIKAQIKVERGGVFEVTAFVFPGTSMRTEAMHCSKWLNFCLLMGSSKLVPCFVLLAWETFLPLLNSINLDPWVFIFCSSIPLLHPSWGSSLSKSPSGCLAAGWAQPPTHRYCGYLGRENKNIFEIICSRNYMLHDTILQQIENH